jgi:hypothetical protein
MAFNLFEAPDYYGGLLGEEATQKLQNRALTTGLINAALGYIAQPKNQRYGSALPYLGKALAGGYQAGQETIRSGLTDFENQQKIAEMQRKQKQQQALQGMLSGITDPNERLLAELNTEAYVTNKLKPRERKVEKVGNQLVDVSGETPSVLFTGENQPNDTAFIKNYEYAVSKGYQGSPADWQKLTIETAQQYQQPFKAAEQERQDIETAYRYGKPPASSPKSATMQDVSDTARATGKTTAQVIQDLKARGITVQGAK